MMKNCPACHAHLSLTEEADGQCYHCRATWYIPWSAPEPEESSMSAYLDLNTLPDVPDPDPLAESSLSDPPADPPDFGGGGGFDGGGASRDIDYID